MSTGDVFDVVVQQLVSEQQQVQGVEAPRALVILTYVFMDAMAWANLPANRNRVQSEDFIAWVDEFMDPVKAPAEYHYDGTDLYQARCSMLHTLSPQPNVNPRQIAYHDGSHHRYRPELDPNLVILSVPLLVDDFWAAVARFVTAARNGDRTALIRGRFESMFQVMPYHPPEAETA